MLQASYQTGAVEGGGGSHSISQTIVQRIDQSLVLFLYHYL